MSHKRKKISIADKLRANIHKAKPNKVTVVASLQPIKLLDTVLNAYEARQFFREYRTILLEALSDNFKQNVKLIDATGKGKINYTFISKENTAIFTANPTIQPALSDVYRTPLPYKAKLTMIMSHLNKDLSRDLIENKNFALEFNIEKRIFEIEKTYTNLYFSKRESSSLTFLDELNAKPQVCILAKRNRKKSFDKAEVDWNNRPSEKGLVINYKLNI